MSNSPEFAWTEYLGLAGELVRDPREGATEACFRSAISRAYYAAFHWAKDFLIQHDNFVLQGPDVHRKVWAHYLSGPGTGRHRKAIARNGKRLREERGKADYDNPFPDPDLEKAAQGALRLADEVIQQVVAMRG